MCQQVADNDEKSHKLRPLISKFNVILIERNYLQQKKLLLLTKMTTMNYS